MTNPNALYEDVITLNSLYEELMWHPDDELNFVIENGRIVVINRTVEGKDRF